MQQDDDAEVMDAAESESEDTAGPSRTHAPSRNDPRFQLLRDRRGITNKHELSELLKSEANITTSKRTTQETPNVVKRQLVLDEMAKDPTRRRGPRIVREGIIRNHGVHLTREYVEMEMRLQDPEGFKIRDPAAKKPNWVPLVTPGPHYEWNGGGHDKLNAIGFPVWGIRDVWSGKWLGLWVVPNNRLGTVIAYLYLSLVEELGGMPIQSTMDCGPETPKMYDFVNIETFSPEPTITELPGHMFRRSTQNITIKRGWLRFSLRWGNNAMYDYNSKDPQQYELVQWLWPKMIQQELDRLRDQFNNHCVRKDRKKKNPSGVSPNVAMALPHEYNAENYLQPVDATLICPLKEDLGGDGLLQFVSDEFAERAQDVFGTLNTTLALQNVWFVFLAMRRTMFSHE
ncbi:hypothetical protein K439DRAFT_1648765 [Ramaria rubella]|nr:hypothetical protein K439DRAFT_1648765 [Ramaria rubella]